MPDTHTEYIYTYIKETQQTRYKVSFFFFLLGSTAMAIT